jgi:hypothetical protein
MQRKELRIMTAQLHKPPQSNHILESADQGMECDMHPKPTVPLLESTDAFWGEGAPTSSPLDFFLLSLWCCPSSLVLIRYDF